MQHEGEMPGSLSSSVLTSASGSFSAHPTPFGGFQRRTLSLTLQSTDDITTSWARSRMSLGVESLDGSVHEDCGGDGERGNGAHAGTAQGASSSAPLFGQAVDDDLWTSFSHVPKEFQPSATDDDWGSFSAFEAQPPQPQWHLQHREQQQQQSHAQQQNLQPSSVPADLDTLFDALSSGASAGSAPAPPTLMDTASPRSSLLSVLDANFPVQQQQQQQQQPTQDQLQRPPSWPRTNAPGPLEGGPVLSSLVHDANKTEHMSWSSLQILRPAFMDALQLRFVAPQRATAVEVSRPCGFDIGTAAARLWEMDMADLRAWRDSLLPRVETLSTMLVELLAHKDELSFEMEVKQQIAESIVRVSEKYDTETHSTSAAMAASSGSLLRRAQPKSFSRKVVMIPYDAMPGGLSVHRCTQLARILDALEHNRPHVHTYLAEYMATL